MSSSIYQTAPTFHVSKSFHFGFFKCYVVIPNKLNGHNNIVMLTVSLEKFIDLLIHKLIF